MICFRLSIKTSDSLIEYNDLFYFFYNILEVRTFDLDLYVCVFLNFIG